MLWLLPCASRVGSAVSRTIETKTLKTIHSLFVATVFRLKA